MSKVRFKGRAPNAATAASVLSVMALAAISLGRKEDKLQWEAAKIHWKAAGGRREAKEGNVKSGVEWKDPTSS